MAATEQTKKIYALIDYEDTYVQPLILAALKRHIPPEVLELISSISELSHPGSPFLQWRQYESLDFEHLLSNSQTSLANSYIIRKALIRKHYLASTIDHWRSKHPGSDLSKHFPPTVAFEVDYAEFLDDALVEAWELKESWQRNTALAPDEEAKREWWILKPGMSERGQGIRLFSSEEELTEIFEGWDPEDSEDEDDDDDDEIDSTPVTNGHTDHETAKQNGHGITTSHLRHFTAQPYIHAPYLLSSPHPMAGHKFHIRTYVLAVGALKVYVYEPMLALFAATPYVAPSTSTGEDVNDPETLGAHLTNTCLQSSSSAGDEQRNIIHLLHHLPIPSATLASLTSNIRTLTAEIFEAAARTMSTNFQPLPNAFEIFGLDFIVDADSKVWVLEVNAFPDFRQTGDELGDEVVGGLIDEVVRLGVVPFFAGAGVGVPGNGEGRDEKGSGRMTKVLDIDLGRR